MRIPILCFLLVFNSLFASAEKTFDFNEQCRAAYNEIIRLKLDAGQKIIIKEKADNPGNLIPYFLENYIDFFTLFFNEDPAQYTLRVDNLEKRLGLMSEGPENSPFFLFTKSIIHFQWAAIKIKFGYNWDAGWEFRRSFIQVKENQKLFPDFYPNQLYTGSMQVAAGTIPDGYKWLSNMLGIKGTIKAGMKQLGEFLTRKDQWSLLFHNEAIFYYCYLKFYIENNKKEVLDFIHDQHLDIRNNHLFTYLSANLHINSQQSAKAIAIISERNIAPEYFKTSIWDLELGYAKINHLEKDAAIYLERFIKDFKGKFYVKDVLQKLSWHYYLSGDQASADKYRMLILKKGAVETEADKQAFKDAKSGTWPNKLLLQARLLNDGGYYREALALLHGKNYTHFSIPKERSEFCYRAGRLYDDLGANDDAIAFYKQSIELGKNEKEYFAARAALHIGNIFEEKDQCAEALGWYEQCLAMKGHDFKNSLDQRAKAGIKRCKGE